MTEQPFTLRQIAVPAFGPSLLFGLGEGAILPVIALNVRELGGSVALAALVVTLIGIGSLVCNIPASILTTRYGERWAWSARRSGARWRMAICVLVKHLGAFAVGVFMVGMAGSVFGLARQSYLTESVPFRYRARALSTLGGVMRIGLFIGPFLGAAVIPFLGIGGAFWVGVASQLVAAVLSCSIPDLPGEHRLRTVTAETGRPARQADGALGDLEPPAHLRHGGHRRRRWSPRCAPRARRSCPCGPSRSASTPRPSR